MKTRVNSPNQPKWADSRCQQSIRMGTASGVPTKKEKCPKVGKENPKREQKDRIHPGRAPAIL